MSAEMSARLQLPLDRSPHFKTPPLFIYHRTIATDRNTNGSTAVKLLTHNAWRNAYGID